MKKKIAIMLTILMAAGSMSACGGNEDTVRKTAAVDKAVAVSVYQETTTEFTTAETSPVTAETTLPTYEPTEETKADTRENSATQSVAEPKEKSVKHTVANNSKPTAVQQKKEERRTEPVTEKATQKPTQKPAPKPTKKPTQKPTEKPKPKPTQPATEKKKVDLQSVKNSCIAYGKQLGMKHNSSLSTSNASWFSPTDAIHYNSTQEMTTACYGDVQYVVSYFSDLGIKPNEIQFNIIAQNNEIYVVYN